jgi:hypothetical protein
MLAALFDGVVSHIKHCGERGLDSFVAPLTPTALL